MVPDTLSMKGEEMMYPSVFVDPMIDLNSINVVSVIVVFRTPPASSAVAHAKMAGVPLTLEQAEQDVKESHHRFQRDVKRYLESAHIPYKITNTYSSALNGVAMSLPAVAIRQLLHSPEIQSIHANKEISLDPPMSPR
ncbi:hypothetical protein CHR53_24090 [Neobacillus mesonae]|uniref:Inhibitor I9 domain-containing protein n=2 Tax=Neobacillus mesonae TaxID=1193713 RepID=A0A3T0I433_9BACI|nr:hypothetical protein CHR53_24090 [Neobacillus mesonae]